MMRQKMIRRVRMVMIIITSFILLSIISFILLAKFYPPLNLKLFGGEFAISFDDIQFWVKKVPNRNYYKVYARYLKHSQTELPDFGHMIFFRDKNQAGGLNIIFNPEDNKIYGGGWWEKSVYCIGEGKIEGRVFNPIFPEGTEFTFLQHGSLEITDAPGYFITIYLTSTLEKLEKEELEKPSLAEIIGEETRIRK